eukprot:3543117-Pleurochrysis_carterae.AAC.2
MFRAAPGRSRSRCSLSMDQSISCSHFHGLAIVGRILHVAFWVVAFALLPVNQLSCGSWMLVLHSDTVTDNDGNSVDMKLIEEGLVLHHFLSRVPPVLTQQINSRQEKIVADVGDSARVDQVLLRMLRHAAANIVLVGILFYPATTGLADASSHVPDTSTIDSIVMHDAYVTAPPAAAAAAVAFTLRFDRFPVCLYVALRRKGHKTVLLYEVGAAVGIEALSVVATAS